MGRKETRKAEIDDIFHYRRDSTEHSMRMLRNLFENSNTHEDDNRRPSLWDQAILLNMENLYDEICILRKFVAKHAELLGDGELLLCETCGTIGTEENVKSYYGEFQHLICNKCLNLWSNEEGLQDYIRRTELSMKKE
jgi:hypothetical protein